VNSSSSGLLLLQERRLCRLFTRSSSLAYTNFNCHMGEAYWEMGIFDAAVEQFQLASEKEQNPFEAAFILGLFFKKENSGMKLAGFSREL